MSVIRLSSNLKAKAYTLSDLMKSVLPVMPGLIRQFYSFWKWHDLRVMPFPVPSVHSEG